MYQFMCQRGIEPIRPVDKDRMLPVGHVNGPAVCVFFILGSQIVFQNRKLFGFRFGEQAVQRTDYAADTLLPVCDQAVRQLCQRHGYFVLDFRCVAFGQQQIAPDVADADRMRIIPFLVGDVKRDVVVPVLRQIQRNRSVSFGDRLTVDEEADRVRNVECDLIEFDVSVVALEIPRIPPEIVLQQAATHGNDVCPEA